MVYGCPYMNRDPAVVCIRGPLSSEPPAQVRGLQVLFCLVRTFICIATRSKTLQLRNLGFTVFVGSLWIGGSKGFSILANKVLVMGSQHSGSFYIGSPNRRNLEA